MKFFLYFYILLLKLEKLEDMMKYLLHSLTTIMDTDEKISNFYDIITTNIIFFSLVLIIITIISGFIETIFLKRYFRQRKVI
jgi:hypothetical protein